MTLVRTPQPAVTPRRESLQQEHERLTAGMPQLAKDLDDYMADSGIHVATELSVQATGKLIAEAMLEGQPTACPSLAIQDERLTDPSEPAHHPLGSRQDRPVEEGVNHSWAFSFYLRSWR